MNNFYLVVFVSVFFFSACKNSESQNINTEKNTNFSKKLPNSTWQVLQVEGKETSSEYEGMELKFYDKTFSLKLNKNTCEGTFSIEKNNLKIGEHLNCTKICCDNAAAKILKNALKGELKIQKKSGELILSSKDYILKLKSLNSNTNVNGKVKPVFEKKYEVLATVNNATTVLTVQTRPIIFTFTKNNLTVKLDVNTCNSAVSYNESGIEFSNPFACTKMCCDSESSEEVLELLKGNYVFLMEDNYLLLQSENYTIKLDPKS
jgi:heat shock protein HslJ